MINEDLPTATPINITPGEYVLVTAMSAGTSKLQISVLGGSFQDITDASWTADADTRIFLPRCRVQSVLTGDATMSIHLRQKRR